MEKWIRNLLIVLSIIVIVPVAYFLYKNSYNGSSKIILLNAGEKFTSVADIIKRPEFKNKIVYVDVWGTSCPPCFNEFKNYTPQLTERYKNERNIAFLYICLDRHPLPETRWKDRIEKFSPKGYHVLVENGVEEIQLAKEIVGQAKDGEFFPYIPFYFIVDKSGHIIGKPSSDWEQRELQPSDGHLLYHELDSLIEM